MASNARRRVIENYTLQDMLGEGVYGKVYKAKHKQNTEQFAIKVIPVQLFKQNKKLEECTVNQINTLSSIKPSPHIVKYVQMLKTSNNFYFVYEFCNGGTLETILKKQKRLEEAVALDYFRQLLEAFKILVEYNIMHRDIKPDNILFHNGMVKLGDFGFCKNLESDTAMTSTMLGSPIYMAPEVLKGEDYSSKADVWSLGVVLFEMLFGYCPFQSNSIANLISTIKESNLKMQLDINPISEATQQLIRRMLVKDPYQRISWSQIFDLVLKQPNQKPNTLVEKQNLPVKDVESLGKSTSPALSKKESIEEREVYTEAKPIKKQIEKIGSPSSDYKSKDAVSTSLNWQNDPGFKNYLATANNNPKLNKVSVEASLPLEINSIEKMGNLDNFFGNQNSVIESISQSIAPTVSQSISQPISSPIPLGVGYCPLIPTNPKRKQIIYEHELCTRGIKIAIDIINVEQNVTLTYSYLILTKIESKLKKIQDSILSTESELQDISHALKIELISLQKSIMELKDQLVDQDINIKNLDSPRTYLSSKFKEVDSESNIRLWYDMVYILFGETKTGLNSSRDKEKHEMLDYIKWKLSEIDIGRPYLHN